MCSNRVPAGAPVGSSSCYCWRLPLCPPAADQPVVRLASDGLILLDDPAQEEDGFVIVASPPAR